MEDKTVISIIGVICLTVLTAFALYLGFDGYVLLTVGGIIGGIVGYSFGVTHPIPELLDEYIKRINEEVSKHE